MLGAIGGGDPSGPVVRQTGLQGSFVAIGGSALAIALGRLCPQKEMTIRDFDIKRQPSCVNGKRHTLYCTVLTGQGQIGDWILVIG
jgi:hypothetical protein